MPPPLIAVPNVSEGRDAKVVEDLRVAPTRAGARVLDVHSDAIHNRSVFTLAGGEEELVNAAGELARACHVIDLTTHTGVHPRLGALDIFPILVLDGPARAVAAADRAAATIWATAGFPVYLYGEAARRETTRNLPDIRTGGLDRLARRATEDLPPDVGDANFDPRWGVVCVGARPPLIAFNVWVEAPLETARQIAAGVRSRGGGPPGIRALGLPRDHKTSQVSLNLVAPEKTGIDRAFAEIARRAEAEGVVIRGTEIVGLPLERHLPDPKREAARLLIEPSRSLESVLRS